MALAMAPAAGPGGKQVKQIRVGLPFAEGRRFEELKWRLRARSEGELGARLIAEAMEAYSDLLKDFDPYATPPEQPAPSRQAPPSAQTSGPTHMRGRKGS